MEPIGFTVGVVGLAGLFSVCLDVIDKVDSYNDYGVESRSIIAQFEADKHLFTKWAQDIGIRKDELKNNYYGHLDNPEINLIVQKILSSIHEIFSKTESTMSSLQPVPEAGPTTFPSGIHFFNIRKKSENPGGTISKRARIGWSLRSKAKFTYQVQQFGALVQRLHGLVPPDGLTRLANTHKGKIDNDLKSRNDNTTRFSNSQRLLIEMEKKIEHEIRKELDIWLAASWTNDVYDNFIRRRLDGTCDWFLSRQVFLDWISPDFPSVIAKILWINGRAGHGKTILCARVVQHLSTMLESPLAYYFCSSESEIRRDSLTIIRSWMSQVISYNRDAFELACGRWEAKDARNASQTEIIDLFKTIVQHIPNCTFVVDGLDECAWAEEKWKSNDYDSPMGFFESIKQAVAHTATRVLILSRDEPEIRYSLRTVLADDCNQGLSEYKICSGDVQSDALLFSRSIIDKKLTSKSEALKHELSQRMVDRCDGIFLWVKMLEEQLRSWKNKKQLEETIDLAPTALDHLYDRNWIKISHLPDKDKLRAFSILRWTAFALRPLTILEISEALLIVDDDNCEDLLVDDLPDAIDENYISSEILAPCGSLLETRRAAPNQDLGSMTLHLAHFTIKQYLLCNMPAQGGLLMVNERLRASSETFQSNILAKLCLRYLNFHNVWQAPLQLQSGRVIRSFRDYAAGSWYQHTRECGSNYAEVVKITNAFFSSNNGNWESWGRWFDANDDKSTILESQSEITSANPLFYTSLLGLRDTVIYLLEEVKLDLNYVDGFNRTALQAAALKGQTLIVKLLLENGANMTIKSNKGWTPLNSASNNGHFDVVKLLLENGADMTVANNNGWTPLDSASYNGHIDIVKLLLENGADITVADNNGRTPLDSASNNGHFDVVKLLLENGADMTVADNNGWTPLNSASNNGQFNIVKLLLENGADMTVADNDGWTPLNSASESGHIDIVKLLLENGADVTVANDWGWTPLNSASESGYIDIVKLLLENGADITVVNNNGWTSLNSASFNGYVDIVKLLLENGTDMTITSNNGWTPLNSASYNGYIDIVKLLLENGADITVADNNGRTPLDSASNNGHFDVVKLLLENGADMTVANNNGRTPLKSASHNGHVDVVKLLLENGAEFDARGREYQDILQAAASKGSHSLIQLLIEKAKNVNIQDNIFEDALHLTCIKGNIAVLEQLISLGVNPKKADEHGWTPLLCASWFGQGQIHDYLLSNGRDRDPPSPVNTVPPSSWSTIEKSSYLLLDDSLTCVRYSDDIGTREFSAALILANHPVPLQTNGYYYEIEVLSSGDTGVIGLGLCDRYTPLDSLPGWNYASWGYHGDDGKKYFQDTGTPYGTTFKTGDIIGCNVHLKGNIFFTLNGVSLGFAFQDISGKLYPAVGMRSRGAHIRANFGQKDFMYDVTKA